MDFRCRDCSYSGQRFIKVNEIYCCPVCGGNMKVESDGMFRFFREELERQDAETISNSEIENKKCKPETNDRETYE